MGFIVTTIGSWWLINSLTSLRVDLTLLVINNLASSYEQRSAAMMPTIGLDFLLASDHLLV